MNPDPNILAPEQTLPPSSAACIQPAPAHPLRPKDLAIGAHRLQLVLNARALVAAGIGWERIEMMLATPKATLHRFCKRVAAIVQPTAADLAPRFRSSGRKRTYQPTAQDTEALRRHTLITNRTEDSGSVEEAARIALRRGELSPEFAAQVREREAAGQTLVPDRIRRSVMPSPAVVKQFRSPTDADLDYLSAPGTMMWLKDKVTGEKRFIRAGDVLEMDDATINFPVCVPWQVGGCPCSDKFGVKVARFQWLVSIDAASRFVPGFSYTARPKSSYRGEDVVSTLHTIFRQHGAWQRARFEMGVWKSKIVVNALKHSGVELLTVWSPHQKPFIEGLFNLIWTKLSDMPGQVGRFRGEMEAENELLIKCQRGTEDPRHHFPMLNEAVAAMSQACADRNAQRVHSPNYGTWIPEERWADQCGEGRLRPLDESSAWIFSPVVREWTVSGCNIGGMVPMMDGHSVRYDFSAEWLPDFHGAKMRVHFDPFAATDDCVATLVLVDNVRDRQAGDVIGQAVQVNETARYARRAYAFGEDTDLGGQMRAKAGATLRRSVRTFLPQRRSGIASETARNAVGDSVTIETGRRGETRNPKPETRNGIEMPALPEKRRSILTAPTKEEFSRKRERLAEQAAASRRLLELQDS